MEPKKIVLTECPRDAMQGWSRHIPTVEKAEYLNSLLKVGFDVLDFGSFVSPKAIPQLADTAEVLSLLNLESVKTRLLAIVANTRGGREAAAHAGIAYLGFPLSVSETFQQRNTNKSIAEALVEVEEIQNVCVASGKELVVYISMGFGNPYGDPYNAGIAIEQVRNLVKLGVKTIAMSDTIGVAAPDNIRYIFDSLIPEFPHTSIGAHFHSASHNWQEKVEAAYAAGCTRFDSAMKGIGGCPMAEDKLVGNLATEHIVDWCDASGIALDLDRAAFAAAWEQAGRVFGK